MNSCVKTEGKCNESVNNEFKIMRKRNLLNQIMRVSANDKNWQDDKNFFVAGFLFVFRDLSVPSWNIRSFPSLR